MSTPSGLMEKDVAYVEPIIKCRALTKNYEGRAALNEINLDVKRGRIVGLLGPNGSGKTTLLKLINGQLVPDEGEIRIAGAKPGVATKRVISFLPERNALSSWMRVRELVQFFSEKAYGLLNSLHIDKDKRLKTLSKGNKERIQLILVMSRAADLYCLDEPIGGVDPASREYIIDTILKCYDRQGTLLMNLNLPTESGSGMGPMIAVSAGFQLVICLLLYKGINHIFSTRINLE